MQRSGARRTKQGLITICIVASVIAVGALLQRAYSGVTQDASSRQAFDKTRYSLNSPTSLWVIVNKQRALNPAQYTPSDLVYPNVLLRLGREDPEMLLRTEAAQAIESLFAAASKQGVSLMFVSGYRSYDLQATVYGLNVEQLGQTEADTQSARPGHSEHQTGLAADIGTVSRQCEIEACFATLPEGKWLANNAHTYGFIIRYPQHKTAVTGYAYEPWHVRYVGKALAAEMRKQRISTLEEFFGLKAAPQY